MPTFFMFNNGKFERDLSVRQLSISLCISCGSLLMLMMRSQFSGADEALLKENIAKLEEL